jgi:outer membrane protein assembly factor BamB
MAHLARMAEKSSRSRLLDRHRLMAGLLLRATALVLAWQTALVVVGGDSWPQWRGPGGTGVSREQTMPLVWNESRGIAWKCPLPEWGNSTPIIWGRSAFVTSHTHDGRLLLIHIGATTGKTLWTQQVGSGTTPREAPDRQRQKFHRLHNLATPSPVTDGQTVVAHFGNGDLAAYDFNGGQLWKRNLQEDYGRYTIWWGHANSPILFDDLVISVCMHDSRADLQAEPVESYLVAHELTTGKQRWKTLRMTDATAEECDAYTTPLLVPVNGQPQLIVMGGNQLDAYDPATGKQLWWLPGLLGGRTVTNPTVSDGVLFATRGMRKELFAVPIGQKGELSKRDLLWNDDQGTPDSCSPLAHRSLLFTVSDDGIGRCLMPSQAGSNGNGVSQATTKHPPSMPGGESSFLILRGGARSCPPLGGSTNCSKISLMIKQSLHRQSRTVTSIFAVANTFTALALPSTEEVS